MKMRSNIMVRVNTVKLQNCHFPRESEHCKAAELSFPYRLEVAVSPNLPDTTLIPKPQTSGKTEAYSPQFSCSQMCFYWKDKPQFCSRAPPTPPCLLQAARITKQDSFSGSDNAPCFQTLKCPFPCPICQAQQACVVVHVDQLLCK